MIWLATARAFLSRIPYQIWIAIALCLIWYWERDRHADNREAAGRAAVQAQWDKARAAAKAESERIGSKNTSATEKADRDVAQELAQERASVDAFIARGGVRQCSTARTNASPASEGTGVDAGAGEVSVLDDVPVVTVPPEDVRICTENTVKARAWREWGLQIEANHAGGEK